MKAELVEGPVERVSGEEVVNKGNESEKGCWTLRSMC